jgi:hypothetical protein
VRFACELHERTASARLGVISDGQLLDVGTPQTHRLQVAFTAAQRAAIAERAHRAGLPLSVIVRQLVGAALVFDTEPGVRADSPAALAALVAAEHAVLMVASVLPDGDVRMHELAQQAAVAAETRLAMFREVGP